ncbi:MAG TPA: ABC transporter permease [Puia sp.]|nr:ABC transporter permease [Puia sp.]
MFKNYFKTAWRNLLKNRLYSFINIIGLTIGLAVCMLMMEYMEHERSYDRFHANADRICWVQSKVLLNNDSFFTPAVKYLAAPIIKDRVPGVQAFVRLKKERDATIIQNIQDADLRFAEKNVGFADSNFFRFFSFKLLAGNKNEVLTKPYTVVISQKIAKKYFGTEDPVGKVLRFNNTDNFVVSGVAEDAPSNSSITYDFLASMSSLATYNKGQELKETEFATYFLLDKPSDARSVESALLDLFRQEKAPVKVNIRYIATMLPQTHLAPDHGGTSTGKYLSIFPFVAALILLLAVINYSSLSTAAATTRGKEIGVRKVIGAGRKAIALQFFIESALITLAAFVLAYGVCLVCQPAFFRFLNIDIDHKFLYGSHVLLTFFGLFLLSVVLAATYPVLALSALKPLQALYGRVIGHSGGLNLRKFFTGFQFTVAVIIMICGLVIRRQMDFFRHSDTSLRRNNIVMIPFSAKAGRQYSAFKNDIRSLPAVDMVSTSSYPMYKDYDIDVIPGRNGQGFIPLPSLHVDANFIPMLGIRWKIAPLDSSFYQHSGYAVLNEAAVEKIGLTGNPLNQVVNGQFKVAGVVKDFDYSSLQNKIDAMVLSFNPDGDSASGWAKNGGCLFARIKSGSNVPTVIDRIRSVYSKYDDSAPFEYYFMDDVFNSMYSAEDKLHRIFMGFTLFTVVIACLGLLGMSVFAVARRTREISIRRVLGASVADIVTRLSSDLLKPVLVAVAIASPIGWFCMHRWLQGFAYRVHIQWWLLLAAAMIIGLTALITISFQAVRAAMANPVERLKTE